jgi:hypothetical protein
MRGLCPAIASQKSREAERRFKAKEDINRDRYDRQDKRENYCFIFILTILSIPV